MDFAITGKRIVSTQPQKKVTIPPDNKYKIDSNPKPINTLIQRRPSLPSNVKKSQIKVGNKRQQAKKQNLKIDKIPQNKQKVDPIQQKNQIKLQKPPTLAIEEKPQTIRQEKPQTRVIQILVRYNHYKDKFATQNNVLKYQVIEDKYTFASVFKGNYLPKLQIYRNYGKYIDPLTSGTALEYSWQIQQGKQYEVTIAQDEQQQNKHERTAYRAPKEEDKCNLKRKSRVEQLTREMMNMAVQELGSDKHKQLLQQRALQQVLFS